MTFRFRQSAAVRLSVVLATAMVFFSNTVTAQTNTAGQSNAISTAVPFLLINPDARAGALGDAGVANPGGANAQFFNPAILAFQEEQWGANVNYTPWLRYVIPDINLFYVPGYYNLGGDKGVLIGSITYFSLGEIQFSDQNGISQNTYQANEFSISAGYARKISSTVSAAVTLKYVRSDLAGAQTLNGISLKPGESIAGDIGIYYTKPINDRNKLNLGASITNIGSKMAYSSEENNNSFLPTNLKIGTAYTYQVDEYNALTFLLDFNKLMVPSEGGQADESLLSGMFGSFGDAEGGFSEELSEVSTSVGVEYWYNKLFAARAGYFYESPNKGNRKYVTLGAGVKYEDFRLDFAFLVPFEQNNPLQNTLRFSLGYDLNYQ